MFGPGDVGLMGSSAQQPIVVDTQTPRGDASSAVHLLQSHAQIMLFSLAVPKNSGFVVSLELPTMVRPSPTAWCRHSWLSMAWYTGLWKVHVYRL